MPFYALVKKFDDMEKKIVLKITKSNGCAYNEEFDTFADAFKCSQYVPSDWRWIIFRDGKFVVGGSGMMLPQAR